MASSVSPFKYAKLHYETAVKVHHMIFAYKNPVTVTPKYKMLRIFISILAVAYPSPVEKSPFSLVAPKYINEYKNLMRLLSAASVDSHPVNTRGGVHS